MTWCGYLVVRKDIHAVIFPDAEITVSHAEVDANGFSSDGCHDCFVVVESSWWCLSGMTNNLL